MRMKNFNYYGATEPYLFYLYNELGYENLKVSYNYFDKDGEKQFSRHIRYEVLMHLEDWKTVPGTIDTKRQFINKIQHRTILDIEIVADIDDLDLKHNKMFSDMQSKLKWVKNRLESKGYKPIIYKANKGYHLHCLDPKLRFMHYMERKEFKENLLIELGCDIQKAGNTTIAMEGSLHWKSGEKKEEVKI